MQPPRKRPPKLFEDEAAFEQWVRLRLKEVPFSYWLPKNHPYYKRGLPDVIGCVAGHFVALELKAQGAMGDPSRELLQEYEVLKITNAGARVAHFRVEPSDWLKVEEAIYSLLDDAIFTTVKN